MTATPRSTYDLALAATPQAKLDAAKHRWQRLHARNAYQVDVSYDRRGVPAMLPVDEDRSLADDVTGYTVERFRRG